MRLRRGEWRDGHGMSFARGTRSKVKGLRQLVHHENRSRGLETVVWSLKRKRRGFLYAAPPLFTVRPTGPVKGTRRNCRHRRYFLERTFSRFHAPMVCSNPLRTQAFPSQALGQLPPKKGGEPCFVSYRRFLCVRMRICQFSRNEAGTKARPGEGRAVSEAD